ncbi:hypothetical protein QJS66_21460 [Kocuria rhizophila]|nr:hypothetical protein QJS66_21460 [Kocuria rhizophila]
MVRAIVDVDPTALMVGTDCPPPGGSGRSGRGLRVIEGCSCGARGERVLANAARFYLGLGTGGHRAE